MKRYFFFGIGILSLLFLIFLINPLLINTLNSNTAENITFTGNPNNYCYQETANVSTSCGGLNSGVYSINDEFYDPEHLYDGDYSTYSMVFAIGNNPAYFYVNYSKSTNSLSSSLWQVGEFNQTKLIKTNLSVYSCWDYNLTKLVLRSWVSNITGILSWDCYNGTWVNLRAEGDIFDITDEAMIWDYGTLRNLSISKYVNVTSATINLTGVYNNNSNFIFNINSSNIFNTSFDVHNNISAYFLDITGASVGSANISKFNDSNFDTNFNSSTQYIDLYLNNLSFSLPSTSDLKNIKFHLNFGKTINVNVYFGLSPGVYFQCYNWSSNSWTNFLTNSYIYSTSTNYSLSGYIPSNCFNSSTGKVSVSFGGGSPQLIYSGNGVGDFYLYETWITYDYYYFQNKTNNFYSILNTALNNGKCDCNQCFLSGTNCNIPFVFGSSGAGRVQDDDISISYDPKPFVYLSSPENNTQSSSLKLFSCNVTDEINMTNVTLFIWNSTGIYNNTEIRNVFGTSNNITFNEINFTKTDTYKWNCLAYNNGSFFNWYDSNYTINVDIGNPSVNLNNLNNEWLNYKTNIYFNYTPSHSTQTVQACELWSNFTGIFAKNLTDTSISEDIQNYFIQNISDGSYIWNVKCNTSETGNSAFALNNYTINIDTINPIGYNMSITTFAGTNAFNFLSNITDLNLNTCTYSIYKNDGSLDCPTTCTYNVPFTCNSLTSPSVSNYGTYTLSITSNDLASNSINQNLSFTTSASVGITVIGGGGGGESEIQISETFFLFNTNLQSNINLLLAKDSKKPREKTILILNKGKDTLTLTLSCDTTNVNESSRNISICDYVKFLNKTIEVSPNEDNPTQTSFLLFTPDESDLNDKYYFSIIAKNSDQTEYSKLSVSSEVSFLSTIFYKSSYFPFQKDTPDENKSTYSVFLISLILSTIFLIGSIAIFQKVNLLLTGFLIGFLLFFSILGLLPLIL